MEFNTLSFYVGIFLTRMSCFNKMNYFENSNDPEMKTFMNNYNQMIQEYL